MTFTLLNRAHKKTRSVVERGIGQLKRRFHVLHGEIRLEPPLKVCKVVEVCALLHNICKNMNIQMPPEDHDAAAGEYEIEVDDVAPDGDANLPLPHVPGRQLHEGRQYRDHFCNLYFK